jgi:DNA modification methylase
MTAVRAVGLTLINLCVWNKQNGGMGSLYRSKHELIQVLKKGKAPHVNNVELGKWGRYRCNVLEGYPSANSFGASQMQDLADHPTVKPTSLVADAIRDVSHHGDIVLDAFMGSGTTILAAERTGRIAYGVEIEPKYIDVALRRWSQMTGGEPVLDRTGETLAQVAARRAREDTIPSPRFAIDPPARRLTLTYQEIRHAFSSHPSCARSAGRPGFSPRHRSAAAYATGHARQ